MLETTPLDAVIEVRGVTHRYGGVLALEDLSLTIERGSFSAVLGSNGAGKSTLALIIAGMLSPTAGQVRYGALSRAVKPRPGAGLARSGVCLVPEGRRLFADLSIHENLVLGGYGAGLGRAQISQRLEQIVPILPERLRADMRGRTAGMLSGGERQMLALARALMADPSVILIDEPSMGLAPILVDQLYDVLHELHQRGVTIVVIEQQATHALRMATTAHVLERGRLIHSGPAADDAVQEALMAGHVGSGD
ncbi:MAG TPA: ATP-binding cassette domain-containing protein [Ramlibacter sp.]|nr:ATP-binding cassette domain-containing protein [Ramlibacter sp.]